MGTKNQLATFTNRHRIFISRTRFIVWTAFCLVALIPLKTIAAPATNPSPATQPAGGLEFRIAPDSSALTDNELAIWKDQLKTGKIGDRWKDADSDWGLPEYLWLPIAGEFAGPELITGEFKSQKYALVSNKSGDVMIRHEGKGGWGVTKARAVKDKAGIRAVEFSLDNHGAEQFAALTWANVGNHLAMIVNGKIVCAPIIRTPITGGQIMISQNFTQKEADAMAAAIRVGNPALDQSTTQPTTEPSTQASTTDAAVAAQIKALIPEATSIPVADWKRLTSGTSRNDQTLYADHEPSQPISLILIAGLPPGWDRPPMQPDGEMDMSGKTPLLAPAMERSLSKGYVTFIQADCITGFTCIVQHDDTAAGGATYKINGLFSGKLEYLARKSANGWRIEAFHIPGCNWIVQLNAEGLWKIEHVRAATTHPSTRPTTQSSNWHKSNAGLESRLTVDVASVGGKITFAVLVKNPIDKDIDIGAYAFDATVMFDGEPYQFSMRPMIENPPHTSIIKPGWEGRFYSWATAPRDTNRLEKRLERRDSKGNWLHPELTPGPHTMEFLLGPIQTGTVEFKVME